MSCCLALWCFWSGIRLTARLLAGGVLVLVFATILDVENRRLHLLANGLLSTFIGLIIYIILILDHPFAGSLRMEPTDYQEIMIMEIEDS